MERKLPKVIVSALIEKDGKFLLSKETLEDGKEHWIIPGGTVEFGETLEQALNREIMEELGLCLESVSFITFKETMNLKYDYHTVIFFFRARPVGDIRLGDGVLEARFFSKQEVAGLNLVETARWFVETYANG